MAEAAPETAAGAPPKARHGWSSPGVYVALPIWIFGLMAGALWPTFTLILLLFAPVLGTISLALLVIALFTPLDIPCPKPVFQFLEYCTVAASDYYPVSFYYDDKEAVEKLDKPAVIGERSPAIHFFVCLGGWGVGGGGCRGGLRHQEVLRAGGTGGRR